MKLLVLSDTHGNWPGAVRAVDRAGDVDTIVHLGDFCDDALPLETVLGHTVIRVPGNCDTGSRLPREQHLEFGGVPFLLCHGDAYSVKGGVTRIAERAARIGARVALFGHTHLPLVREQDGILLVNPGTLQAGIPAPTFAVITLYGEAAAAEIIPLYPAAVPR